MKKWITFFMTACLVVGIAGLASAMPPPKYVAANVACDTHGNVVLGMPAGATLKNVEVYDDIVGSKPVSLGPVIKFKLEPGQGFNFLWSDGTGTQYQLITPSSRAPGLISDPSWIGPDGQPKCKWVYIPPKK